jgi:IclR family acetate operon transcriptional repressor
VGAGKNEKYMVPVVHSTFRILEELSRTGGLGLNEITKRTDVSKSTVFRILTTLSHMGYIIRDDNRNYFTSPNLGNLVSEAAVVESLKRLSLPHMLALRDQFSETVNLGHLQFDKVRYIEVIPSEYALRLHEQPGATVAAHASALGKVILAFSPPDFTESLLTGKELEMFTRHTVTDPEQLMRELEQIRKQGYGIDRGQISNLATCVAAPILSSKGTSIAAMSISGPTSRFDPPQNSPVIESLMLVAAKISKQFSQRNSNSRNKG